MVSYINLLRRKLRNYKMASGRYTYCIFQLLQFLQLCQQMQQPVCWRDSRRTPRVLDNKLHETTFLQIGNKTLHNDNTWPNYNGFELSSKQKARVINYKKGEETCIFLYFFLLLFMK